MRPDTIKQHSTVKASYILKLSVIINQPNYLKYCHEVGKKEIKLAA